MFIYWCFNSAILILTNCIVVLYIGQRFFRVMRNHHRLITEITEFNSIVRESRLSLDYTAAKVSEALEEIENDINEELNVTHSLTAINEKMGSLLPRFAALEEQVIELVRTNYNMTNISVATPTDINSEVKKILRRKKKKLESLKKKSIDNMTSDGLILENDCSLIE